MLSLIPLQNGANPSSRSVGTRVPTFQDTCADIYAHVFRHLGTRVPKGLLLPFGKPRDEKQKEYALQNRAVYLARDEIDAIDAFDAEKV